MRRKLARSAHHHAQVVLLLLSCLTGQLMATAQDTNARSQADLRSQAEEALRRAVYFYHRQVASHGGYVWYYSADLKKREGEGKADAETVWVQPPGTPSVGMAYLEAYERTGNDYLLAAARDAASCLIQGQLQSGGWTYRIEFAAAKRAGVAYRVDPPANPRAFNWSTLDDDTTQSAVRFLVRLDQALQFSDAAIHQCALAALDALLQAQYPNGAWPQGFQGPPDPLQHPVLPARYPQEWSREYVKQDYWRFYTLNDDALATTIDTMFLAYAIYADERYRQAAMKAGDFLLLAQMPEPQPAWAQQYDFQMHPTWARKFEPPAVTGGESQGAIRILLRIYEETGERKYLEPVPKALDYLSRSALPDGRLARFYELQTNRPLYFTRQYQLTYDDSDLPTHYGFKVDNRTAELRTQYETLLKLTAKQLAERRAARYRQKRSRPSTEAVRTIIAQLDPRGAWVEPGRLRTYGADDPTREVISSRTFIKNIDILSRFLAER